LQPDRRYDHRRRGQPNAEIAETQGFRGCSELVGGLISIPHDKSTPNGKYQIA
jgi:hypothetical protein